MVPFIAQCCHTKLSPESQLLMVPVRLRLSLPFEYLAMQTKLSLSTVNATFQRVINILHEKLKLFIHWPDQDILFQTLPPIFKANLPRLTSIIDCCEIIVEHPRNLKARAGADLEKKLTAAQARKEHHNGRGSWIF